MEEGMREKLGWSVSVLGLWICRKASGSKK